MFETPGNNDLTRWKAFIERVQKHHLNIQRTLPKRLKWQMSVLERVLEGRTRTFRVRLFFR